MTEEPRNTIRQLSRIQRRVLGTLIEKGFTTPEQYPLTLKSATTGCNQKSNRDPVTEYSEDEVADALEQLRELGLIAEVFSDGGRAARYRHYIRHKFDFSEPQIAVMAELMLRGRQQPGELRTRASRMVRIDSQDQLKAELQGLQEKGYLQSDGSLDRRGVEVDHTLYTDREKERMPAMKASDAETVEAVAHVATPPEAGSQSESSGSPVRLVVDQVTELTAQVSRLQDLVHLLAERIDRLERELGV